MKIHSYNEEIENDDKKKMKLRDQREEELIALIKKVSALESASGIFFQFFQDR